MRLRYLVALAALVMSQSATAANINDAFLAMEAGTPALSFPGPNGGTITLGYNLTPTTPGTFDTTGLIHYTTYGSWPSVKGFAPTNGLPAVAVNTLGSANAVTGSITIGTDQIYLHPGNPSGNPVIAPFSAAVLRYTVPTTDRYDVTGSFDSIDSGTAGVNLLRNGIPLLLSGGAGSDATAFSELGVLLKAGDSLDFVVGDRNGNVFSDSTGLYANVALSSHTISGHVTSDNQFAIFTSAAEVPVTYRNLTGCHPAAVAVNFTTTDRYLYIAAWSDDSNVQGLLHDLNVSGLPGADDVPSHDPRWSVKPMDSDQDACLSPPFTAIEATMNSVIPGGGWSAPATTACTNSPGCFETSPGVYTWGYFTSISPTARRAWYNSGLQGTGGDIPFKPGFNHREFLVFRLDMDGPAATPVPSGSVAGPVVAALLVMTGLLTLTYRQRRHGRAA